ncbi:MAG: glycosyltransferase [Terriglobales bacterium]
MPSLAHTVAAALAALPGGAAGLQRAAGVQDGRAAPIFMLHRVLPEAGAGYDAELVVTAQRFEQFASWVTATYDVVPLEELQPRLAQAPKRPLCALTFDDGWADTYRHAFPIWRKWGIPVTVFLPLAFMGTGRHFWQERLWAFLRQNDGDGRAGERVQEIAMRTPWCPRLDGRQRDFKHLRALLGRRSSAEAEAFVDSVCADGEPPGQRAFLSWEEIAIMQGAGVRFGSHTVEHTLLSWAAPAPVGEELQRSRRLLADKLGAPVTTFAYPWGGLSPFVREQVRAAGFRYAVTTQEGMVRAGADGLLLPRIALSDARLASSTLALHLARARRRRPACGRRQERRLRVGFLIDNPEVWVEPPQGPRGGSELQLERVMEALTAPYFEPELYFLYPARGTMPARLPWPVFAPATGSHGRVATFLRLYRLLRQRRPDVVQSLFEDSTFLGVPAAWLARTPSILCARRNAGYWKRWYHRAALRLINRMANAWQVNAAAIATMLNEVEGVAARAIDIVPNEVDLVRLHPASPPERDAARAQLGLGADEFVAVAVANYRPIKDLELWVRVAVWLQGRIPGLRLVLVGEGDERPRLERAIAASSVSGEVRLAGSSADIAPYLAAADAGVLASRSEGCSNAVLEYMAAGLPVVVSDIAANRDLVSEGLFAVGDAAAAGAELLRLAGDGELRRRRGAHNRTRAEAYGGGAFRERVQAHYLRAAALGLER